MKNETSDLLTAGKIAQALGVSDAKVKKSDTNTGHSAGWEEGRVQLLRRRGAGKNQEGIGGLRVKGAAKLQETRRK